MSRAAPDGAERLVLARTPAVRQLQVAPSATDRGVDRAHFGVHLGVDEDTLLVRRAVLTPANVAESEVANLGERG